jgi:hypothetical protein
MCKRLLRLQGGALVASRGLTPEHVCLRLCGFGGARLSVCKQHQVMSLQGGQVCMDARCTHVHARVLTLLLLVCVVCWCAVQPVVPPRFCDDRVAVLRADARTLTPAILESYTKDVSAGLPL